MGEDYQWDHGKYLALPKIDLETLFELPIALELFLTIGENSYQYFRGGKKKNRKSHQSISPMKNILSKELFIQRTLLIWSSRMAQELEKIDKYRGTDF